MSKATPTPAPTAGHETRRSTSGTYVAIYTPDCRTTVMPSSSSCRGVPVDSTRYTAQRRPLWCHSSAQAPPGIEGLGLSKEETRIVLVNTMHSHVGANSVPSISYPLIFSEGAALLMQLPVTKP